MFTCIFSVTATLFDKNGKFLLALTIYNEFARFKPADFKFVSKIFVTRAVFE